MSVTEARPERGTVGRILPIELADGVFWMGDCFVWPAPPGKQVEHAYTSCFLVEGTERSLLVDTGHPNDWAPLHRQLEERAAAGAPPLEWIFPTHPEVTHAANLWRLMSHYPEARMVGDIRDHHLSVPEFTDRFVTSGPATRSISAAGGSSSSRRSCATCRLRCGGTTPARRRCSAATGSASVTTTAPSSAASSPRRSPTCRSSS